MPHPPLDLLEAEKLWVPTGERYDGITERYAILNAGDLKFHLTTQDLLLTGALRFAPARNPESLILQQLTLLGAKSRIGFFPFFMYTVRTLADKSRWSWGVPIAGTPHMVKYPPELFQSAEVEAMVKTHGWEHTLKTWKHTLL